MVADLALNGGLNRAALSALFRSITRTHVCRQAMQHAVLTGIREQVPGRAAPEYTWKIARHRAQRAPGSSQLVFESDFHECRCGRGPAAASRRPPCRAIRSRRARPRYRADGQSVRERLAIGRRAGVTPKCWNASGADAAHPAPISSKRAALRAARGPLLKELGSATTRRLHGLDRAATEYRSPPAADVAPNGAYEAARQRSNPSRYSSPAVAASAPAGRYARQSRGACPPLRYELRASLIARSASPLELQKIARSNLNGAPAHERSGVGLRPKTSGLHWRGALVFGIGVGNRGRALSAQTAIPPIMSR